MADQWNDNVPAMGNQINADIPDIEENFGHMRSSFERVFKTWSQANGGNASAKYNPAVGFNDGTYNYEFPTNGVAGHSVIMLGNSSTIIWFYLNSAPPGWKALSTGADTVLAVSGGSGDYNVNGGNPDNAASWEIDGFTAANESTHTHTLAAGSSSTSGTGTLSEVYKVGSAIQCGTGDAGIARDKLSVTTGAGAAHAHTISHDSTYRPSASVGKLFQLDTA